MQVQEVRLQVLGVFGPRHLVDARRCGLLQSKEARSQNVDVDVMQKRRMQKISYAGYRFPPEILRQAIWLYLRSRSAFAMSKTC